MSKLQRRTGWIAAGLAGLAILVCTATAGAEVVSFTNPDDAGHFDWAPGVGGSVVLDFTLAADQQPGVAGGPTSVRQLLEATTASCVTDAPLHMMTGSGEFPAEWFLVGVDYAVEIPPAPDTSWWSGSSYQWFDGQYPPTGTLLPLDTPTYLGVRFDLGDGDQYGWIGVTYSSADHTLDAFAWGYQTTPGVPILAGVPEPGTLALLAFGAAAVVRRRRA